MPSAVSTADGPLPNANRLHENLLFCRVFSSPLGIAIGAVDILASFTEIDDRSPCILLPVQTDSWCLRHMAGASLKVEFLQYPFTLAIGFLDSYRMLRSDKAQPREEQLTMANADSTHASGAFAS
jgi:hypothetical protein